MGKLWFSLLLVLAVCLGSGQVSAATFVLTDRERDAAIALGRSSIYTSTEFGGEWRVKNAAGDELTVATPFYRLALAARNAAFKGDALKPRDIDSLLKAANGKLELWTTLRGPSPDFARFFGAALVPAGGAEIKPSFAQNERTALPEGGGRYAARCLYVFPTEGLKPAGSVSLVVRTPTEAEVARFGVDLAAIR